METRGHEVCAEISFYVQALILRKQVVRQAASMPSFVTVALFLPHARFGVVLYNDEFKNQTAFITGERCSPRSRHLAGVLDRTEVKGFVMPGDFKVLASIIGEHSVKTVRNSTSRSQGHACPVGSS